MHKYVLRLSFYKTFSKSDRPINLLSLGLREIINKLMQQFTGSTSNQNSNTLNRAAVETL